MSGLLLPLLLFQFYHDSESALFATLKSATFCFLTENTFLVPQVLQQSEQSKGCELHSPTSVFCSEAHKAIQHLATLYTGIIALLLQSYLSSVASVKQCNHCKHRGEDCHYWHNRRQRKIFASVENFSIQQQILWLISTEITISLIFCGFMPKTFEILLMSSFICKKCPNDDI